MSKYTLAKPKSISLLRHPDLTGSWLQQRIVEDPTILGLGDVAVIERERRQDSGGRLDLLLSEPAEDRRYEVELQLGATDERHIIRTLEYWDIERPRYPQYDHCAVLIAEDVTSRFLNVLGLFNGHVPISAIQLSAMVYKDEVILNFVRVVDRLSMRRDDESEVGLAITDRDYWLTRVGKEKVELCDAVLGIVNGKADGAFRLNCNKQYIGLADSTRSNNFIHFHVKKSRFRLLVEVSNLADWSKRLEDAGIEAEARNRFIRVPLDRKLLEGHRPLFEELVGDAVAYMKS